MSEIAGVLPVIATPFDSSWGLDCRVLRREIDWLIAQGADGVTIAMVSEVLRLTDRERRLLTEEVAVALDGRGCLVASVGAESIEQAVGLVEHAVSVDATAVMANPPLTTGPLSSEQLMAYFSAIVEVSQDLPVIIQDASGYVGVPLDLTDMATLYKRFGGDKVQFKPEAQPLGARLTELLELTEGMGRVFEGSGGLALVDNFQRGIVGSMPGPDMVWAIVALWRALTNKDWETAYRIQERLSPVLSLVTGLDSYVALEKHHLRRQGIFDSDRQRQPVSFVLDEQTRSEFDRLVDRLADVVRAVDRRA